MDQLDRVEKKVDQLITDVHELTVNVERRLVKTETDIAWTKGSVKIIIPVILSIVGYFVKNYI